MEGGEGLDVAQMSWKGSASGSSAQGWQRVEGGPRRPLGTVPTALQPLPQGCGGALAGPAILRAL